MYGLDNHINIGAPERREEVVLTWWTKVIDIHCSCELWEKKISMFSIYGETLPKFYFLLLQFCTTPHWGPLASKLNFFCLILDAKKFHFERSEGEHLAKKIKLMQKKERHQKLHFSIKGMFKTKTMQQLQHDQLVKTFFFKQKFLKKNCFLGDFNLKSLQTPIKCAAGGRLWFLLKKNCRCSCTQKRHT